jgi:hypothetical protein
VRKFFVVEKFISDFENQGLYADFKNGSNPCSKLPLKNCFEEKDKK